MARNMSGATQNAILILFNAVALLVYCYIAGVMANRTLLTACGAVVDWWYPHLHSYSLSESLWKESGTGVMSGAVCYGTLAVLPSRMVTSVVHTIRDLTRVPEGSRGYGFIGQCFGALCGIVCCPCSAAASVAHSLASKFANNRSRFA